MNSPYLSFSAKFISHLWKHNPGLFIALLEYYEKFLKQQNFPFELKDKRIAKESVIRSLYNYYAPLPPEAKRKLKQKDIIKQANDIVEEIFKVEKKGFDTKPLTTEEQKKMAEDIKRFKKKNA